MCETRSITSHITCNTKNVIYMVQCNRCNLQYIGETKRRLKDRFNEHRRAVDKTNIKYKPRYNPDTSDLRSHLFLEVHFVLLLPECICTVPWLLWVSDIKSWTLVTLEKQKYKTMPNFCP